MQSKFSRKHYQAIAKVILDFKVGDKYTHKDLARCLIKDIMLMFYEDNKKFNIRKFNEAIGNPLWNGDIAECKSKIKEI